MLEASLEAATEETRVIERVVEKVIERLMRRRLPDTRESVAHKFNVAGHEGYLIVGLYEDGTPGELFITMAKEGSTMAASDSLGTAISVALQYGVPVQSLVTKFAHQRFEPMGMTTNSEIPFAKSLVDYIFRWFGMQFVPGYREQNAPRRTPAANAPSSTTTTKSANVKEDIEQSDSAGPGEDRWDPPTRRRPRATRPRAPRVPRSGGASRHHQDHAASGWNHDDRRVPFRVGEVLRAEPIECNARLMPRMRRVVRSPFATARATSA